MLSMQAAEAQQSSIPDYATARDSYFWNRLYSAGGETLYCGHVFVTALSGNGRRSLSGEPINVEHAYSADWIAGANGCPNRNECEVPAYKFAEADLHNLWPAVSRINSSRADLPFAELAGEDARRFQDICPDYERSSGQAAVVEPRDEAKGNLARSILYMMVAYDLPAEVAVELLARWHFEDPPDEVELWRNAVIEGLQGNRNPFIDYPRVLALLIPD